MLELMNNIGCNIEEISRTLSASSFGGIIGSLSAGVSGDIGGIGIEMKFAIILVLFGTVCAVKSITTNLAWFGVLMAVEGFSGAAMNIRK